MSNPSFMNWENPKEREDMVRQLTQKGYISSHEIRPVDKNGVIKTCLVSGKVFKNKGIFEGSLVDITERKKVEESFKASEEKYHTMVMNLMEGYYRARLDGKLQFYNNEFIRILGLDMNKDHLGTKLPEFWQDVKDRKKYIDELMETGFLVDYLVNAKKSDGEKMIIQANSQLIKDGNGKPLRIDGTFLDITEKKNAEESLKDTLEKLTQSNKELQQFVYITSHDLQEPLRKITSFTELLEKSLDGKLNEKTEKYMNYILSGSSRMKGMINDLLTYSRVISQGNPFVKTSCDTLLKNVKDNLEYEFKGRKVNISSERLPTIYADEVQITRVFQNLIGNAIKFNTEETSDIKITLEVDKKDWRFSIHDNGIGIEAKYYERIFEIFQRLHTKEEYPGTGIGLAVCKRIIGRHGGKIWVRSEPGNGSEFIFTIPKERSNEKQISQE